MISASKYRPQEIAAGAALSVVLALAAYAIAYRYGAPAMLMGLLLGLSCHFLSESDRFARGLLWASGPCLRFGVALLGVRLSVGDVAALGSRRGTGKRRCHMMERIKLESFNVSQDLPNIAV